MTYRFKWAPNKSVKRTRSSCWHVCLFEGRAAYAPRWAYDAVGSMGTYHRGVLG